MDNNANIELLRGHMDTIILCTLLPGDKYGLEILKEIVDSSQELYTLKQPTLYSALKRLTADGFVSSYEGDISNGRKRVYYSLTEKGRKFVTEDQLQWEFSRTIIDKLISDKVFDPVLNEKPFDPSEFRPSTKRSKSKSEEFESQNEQLNSNYNEQNVKYNTPYQKTEEIDAVEAQQNSLPYGVTSGAINSSSYNNESIVSSKPIESPIKVANTDKVSDKFYFTSEVSHELKQQELQSRQGYRDQPASLSSLFDTKWEKPALGIKKVEEPKQLTPNEQFAFNSAIPIATNKEIDDIDRKTAASMLYSSDYNVENTAKNSNLPDSLTHYDLGIKPKTDNIAKSNLLEYDLNNNKSKPKFVEKRYEMQADEILPANVSADDKSVNYISTLGNIFNSPSSQKVQSVENKKADLYTYDQNINIPAHETQKSKVSSNVYVEDMNFAKLKSKLYEEDIILKQYVKSETSNYYVNKYYYSNKILRDWSYIAYAIFALFCIISYCSTLSIPTKSLGAFLGIMFSAATLPIFTTVKWFMNKSGRKSANFSYAHTMVTGAIVTLILLMAILAISFFAFKINVSDVKTLVNPLILPLISLLMIPLDITVFSLLYNSKRYHLR